jgi:2-hydroxychromene-2-carboxylate isomerase
MSLKTIIVSRLASYWTGQKRLLAARARSERRRLAQRLPHRIDWFHDVGDPYSHLLAQLLPAFSRGYNIEIVPHLVGPPEASAAPERDQLDDYARIDAARLAGRAGLAFTNPGTQPSLAARADAEAVLAALIADDPRGERFLAMAASVGTAIWSGAAMDPALRRATNTDTSTLRTAGDTRRASLGHYLGATLHYGGEWYWGIDRLHYLEERLAALGARRTGVPETLLYPPPVVPTPGTKAAPRQPGLMLDWYLSFRSPYTYIVADRIKALADAYGAELRLRFVLPMVMRNLPVPPMKRNYITLDVAREARRLGIAFGRVADPVGRPVERGYSLLPWAIAQGRGHEFATAFLRGVFAHGIDAGSDNGLRQIVETAGLDWAIAKPLIGNDDWRAEAEVNRNEMTALGLWGVPSFRVGDVAAWGQDRLWVIEAELQRRVNESRKV